MNIRGASVKVRTLLCAGIGVLVAVALLVWFCRPAPLRVKVIEPNFHVLGVKVLRGGRDSFYLGNQTEGRLRDYLAQRLHLNVKRLPDIGAFARSLHERHGAPHPGVFVIWYSPAGVPSATATSQLPSAFFPPPLSAELRNSSGAVIPVGTGLISGTKPYWQSYNLDFARTNAGNYKLRLKWAGACVAEVEIDNLPAVHHKPYHVGPNAY
jgi:hypothetical protein